MLYSFAPFLLTVIIAGIDRIKVVIRGGELQIVLPYS